MLIDESGVMLAPLVRRSLAPKGRTPLLKIKASHRDKVSLIAALTLSPNRRRLGFYFSSMVKDHFEQSAVAWFLQQLLRKLRGPVIVIWDRGNMHRGHDIRQLLERNPRLTLKQLPPYAPELNPTEQIWEYLKWSKLCNLAATDVYDLDQHVFRELDAVRYDQERLQSFWLGSDLPVSRALAS